MTSMELIRGKTFIKSSAPLNPDKQPAPDGDVGKKEDARKISSAPVIRECCPVEAKPPSLAASKNNKCLNRPVKAGQREGTPTCGASSKLVPKSKTHDGTLETEKNEHGAKKVSTREEGSAAPTKIKGRLVGSASFSGIGNQLTFSGKRDSAVSPCQSSCSQKMIDYRNFVPQVPFVPAVAKSIPRKRISLKRSKKGLRDIFHIKKNKQENFTISLDKDKALSPELSGWLGTTHLLKAGEVFAGGCLAPEVSDGEIPYDPTYEYCNIFCEDAASLKSFDSLTGCGEIFADESSAHVEFLNGKENQKARIMCKRNLGSESFQGGMEQLASPAQSEAIDFTKFWGHVNQSVRLQQSALIDRRMVKTPNPSEVKEKEGAPLKDFPLLVDKGLETPKDSSPDTETPKSDLQESTSTSDEGYYDSFSPGPDDEKKESRSPGTFPRDSYSGDALYELFHDHSEALISPSLDDELSMSGHNNELPLSICSFHVGAEETMASRSTIDMVSQGFLQSTWKGKECLLKLCDTELSLTMGIINWLRNNPAIVSPVDSAISPRSDLRERRSPMVSPNSPVGQQTTSENQALQMVETDSFRLTASTDNGNGLPLKISEERTEASAGEMTELVASKNLPAEEASRDNCDKVVGDQLTSPRPLSSKSSERPPQLHGHKLRVCLPAMVKGPISDQQISPGDTHQVMVGIGKDALCPSCRNALERDQSVLELCCVCIAKLQRMDGLPISGENRNQLTNNDNPPYPLPKRHSKGFVSPSYAGHSQTIVQILEQCVAQVASLQITYKSDQKNAENKCIGNEMKNMLCKMSQYRKNILCPTLEPSGQNSEESGVQAIRLPTTIRHNFGVSPVEIQESRTFSSVNGQHTPSETQMNEQLCSYRAINQILLSPGEVTPAGPPSRPNYLPLCGPFSSVGPRDVLSSVHQMHSSSDNISECNQPKRSWELFCSQSALAKLDMGPSPPDAPPSEGLRSRTSSVTR